MIQIYHPRKDVKGFACSFWQSRRDGAFMATILKQSGWDEARQNGVFGDSRKDPMKNVTIKLGQVEVAGILDCIERNRPFSTFHDSDQKPKRITFVPWNTAGDNPVQQGYSFTVSVSDKQDASYKNSFYIGLKFAEARLIREYLIFLLHKSFEQDIQVVSDEQTSEEQPSKPLPEPTKKNIVEKPTEQPSPNEEKQSVKKDDLFDF